ncbi:hypothetical protein PSC67_01765 [Fusobacterium nucleatum]|nr:hypothetical protein [Fusobacterium nucleatum]WDF25232.1 hypothetical protein PSC67_01765 [Fusobacterium nucleatum]
MKKFFKILIIILLIPVIFIGVLKLYYLIIPGKEIGIKGDWISFSGGYIGSIIALWGIWWQVSNEKKDKEIKEEQKYKNFKKYVERIIDFNLKELENSRENIIKTYTYHIRFLNRQEIYNFKEINETLFKIYIDKIIEEDDNILIDLYNLQLELKLNLDKTIGFCDEKARLMDKITIFKNEKKEIFEKENNNILKLYYFEQFMIFNNFLSASLLTAYPNDNSILFYTGEIIGFITSKNLEKDKYTFRNYTANNRLLKKEINEKTPIDLYWRFYDELMNVLTFSRLFPDTEEQNRYKEYREVYLDISRLIANDNNRKKLIEKYEEILKKCKKIY